MLGAVILYGFGRMLPLERLERLGFNRDEIEQASGWFNKKGRAAVLLCRCVPVVRSLISIPAGAARMRMTPFLLLTCIGTAAWDTALIYRGAAAGNSWRLAAGKFHYNTAAVLFLIFSFAVTLLPMWWIKKKAKGKS